tara:strand:- start:82 stop:309 length:228 start_codon:yes stop_codon:yes gene_type:complete
MKKIIIILLFGLFLNGCAPILDASSPGTVIIKNCLVSNQADALAMAQKQCQLNGRNAVKLPDDTPDGICTYECKQ